MCSCERALCLTDERSRSVGALYAAKSNLNLRCSSTTRSTSDGRMSASSSARVIVTITDVKPNYKVALAFQRAIIRSQIVNARRAGPNGRSSSFGDSVDLTLKVAAGRPIVADAVLITSPLSLPPSPPSTPPPLRTPSFDSEGPRRVGRQADWPARAARLEQPARRRQWPAYLHGTRILLARTIPNRRYGQWRASSRSTSNWSTSSRAIAFHRGAILLLHHVAARHLPSARSSFVSRRATMVTAMTWRCLPIGRPSSITTHTHPF